MSKSKYSGLSIASLYLEERAEAWRKIEDLGRAIAAEKGLSDKRSCLAAYYLLGFYDDPIEFWKLLAEQQASSKGKNPSKTTKVVTLADLAAADKRRRLKR